jgi:hypothetical protein
MPVLSVLGRQRSQGSKFKASPGKKLVRPYLNKETRHDACNPSYMESVGRRIRLRLVLGKNLRLYPKNN